MKGFMIETDMVISKKDEEKFESWLCDPEGWKAGLQKLLNDAGIKAGVGGSIVDRDSSILDLDWVKEMKDGN